MSVHKNARTESKLQVFVLARDLAAYTLQITANEKVFLPKYHACTDEIVRLALMINTELWTANNIVVNDSDNYVLRKHCQESACRNCNALLALIEVAGRIFHLESRRLHYWADKIVEVRNKTRAWKETDAKRYQQYR